MFTYITCSMCIFISNNQKVYDIYIYICTLYECVYLKFKIFTDKTPEEDLKQPYPNWLQNLKSRYSLFLLPYQILLYHRKDEHMNWSSLWSYYILWFRSWEQLDPLFRLFLVARKKKSNIFSLIICRVVASYKEPGAYIDSAFS